MDSFRVLDSNLADVAPVYCELPGQFGPQPAFIQIDFESKEIWADWSGSCGTNERVCYGIARQIDIPPESSGKAISELLVSRNFIDLVHRVSSGYEKIWNGRNYVGRYGEDAEEAIEEIWLLADSLDSAEIIDAVDFLFDEIAAEISSVSSEKDIEELVRKAIDTHKDIHFTDIYDLKNCLFEKRDDLLGEGALQ